MSLFRQALILARTSKALGVLLLPTGGAIVGQDGTLWVQFQMPCGHELCTAWTSGRVIIPAHLLN